MALPDKQIAPSQRVATLLIAIMMAVGGLVSAYLFVGVRDRDAFEAYNQSYAKIDAAYYNYLVKRHVDSVDAAVSYSPNPQTAPFMLLLFALKEVGIEGEFVRAFFNTAVLSILVVVCLRSLRMTFKASLWFVVAISPLCFYGTFASKEFFVLAGLLSLLVYLGSPKRKLNWMIFGLLLMVMARPIMGLMAGVSVFAAIVLGGRVDARRCLLIFVVGLIGFFAIFQEYILAAAYLYQVDNIANQGVSCLVLGVDFCISGLSPSFDNIKVLALRLVSWPVLRFFKGLILPFESSEAPLEGFETYINAANMAASYSVVVFLGLSGVFGKWWLKKASPNKDRLWIFSASMLFMLLMAAGMIDFFQTQRIFLFVYPLICVLIWDRARHDMVASRQHATAS